MAVLFLIHDTYHLGFEAEDQVNKVKKQFDGKLPDVCDEEFELFIPIEQSDDLLNSIEEFLSDDENKENENHLEAIKSFHEELKKLIESAENLFSKTLFILGEFKLSPELTAKLNQNHVDVISVDDLEKVKLIISSKTNEYPHIDFDFVLIVSKDVNLLTVKEILSFLDSVTDYTIPTYQIGEDSNEEESVIEHFISSEDEIDWEELDVYLDE
ncbi:hypothetical protein K9M48_00840 [Candidatus Gracilibacteria bacterium]|nr:hypothetical protein [Candidatus Gracilibacteria bacterium]